MNNNVLEFKDTTGTMIFEVDQAASGLNSITDMARAYMESKARGVKYDNTLYDIFWVIEQLSNHQRYMLERINKRVDKIQAIELSSGMPVEELSFSAPMLEKDKNEVCSST